ncbi:sigma-54 interaction domain-containing protein [Aminipila luticellarii]|uniref:HTH-type transcriptional regulatory protein TyrR n=1 Tax=Aminipila luticellarii TaxID=2507160 RepID=A0A410PUS1_9FIRM|nr:sigma 54-interacting transcriptional regulator [Aminipila luticellarii]QAT42638.1 Fis family transcriptional regulator [Aminipila luticellarii]
MIMNQDYNVMKIPVAGYLETDFYRILEILYDDFTIISNTGVIESVLPKFEAVYGIPIDKAIGSTIMEMEEAKIFNPCVSMVVLRTLEPVTMLQRTINGTFLMCTSIPILNEDGTLYKIVSYTRDSEKYEHLTEEYENLQRTLKAYDIELSKLRKRFKREYPIIGSSPQIQNSIYLAEKYAGFDANLLITGESGVGKNLFTNLIHQNSKRKSKPLVSINCGAIPENLLESEFFGYEAGAFTGASSSGKEGLIQLSHGGTLFLDEIGELPLRMQVKLLKVIQEKKVMPVGGTKEISVDFRLITATNKDLKQMIREGKFREDLFYRLNVLTLHIPSLRERKSDIFSLVDYFCKKFKEQYHVTRSFSSKAMEYLESYSWPGNIRELENTIERAVLTSDNMVITEQDLPVIFQPDEISLSALSQEKTLKEILQTVEKTVLLNTYKKYRTTTGVAKALGISQPSASLKLEKYLDRNTKISSSF